MSALSTRLAAFLYERSREAIVGLEHARKHEAETLQLLQSSYPTASALDMERALRVVAIIGRYELAEAIHSIVEGIDDPSD